MTALDNYKDFAREVNATDEKIAQLYAVKRAQIRALSDLLAGVILEHGYLGAITWNFDSTDQQEIVLRATHDAAYDVLKDFLSAKSNTYYDLMRSPDNDLVVLELVFVTPPDEMFLKIHRDFVDVVTSTYKLTRFNHESFINYLTDALVSAQYVHHLATLAGVGVEPPDAPVELKETHGCDCGKECTCDG